MSDPFINTVSLCALAPVQLPDQMSVSVASVRFNNKRLWPLNNLAKPMSRAEHTRRRKDARRARAAERHSFTFTPAQLAAVVRAADQQLAQRQSQQQPQTWNYQAPLVEPWGDFDSTSHAGLFDVGRPDEPEEPLPEEPAEDNQELFGGFTAELAEQSAAEEVPGKPEEPVQVISEKLFDVDALFNFEAAAAPEQPVEETEPGPNTACDCDIAAVEAENGVWAAYFYDVN